jgi:hypothetical protein
MERRLEIRAKIASGTLHAQARSMKTPLQTVRLLFLSCAKWYASKLFCSENSPAPDERSESGMEAFIMLYSLCVILLATAAWR